MIYTFCLYTLHVRSVFSKQNDCWKHPEPCAIVVIYLHTAQVVWILPSAFADKQKIHSRGLLFKPGVQFQLTDSEEIFLPTCTFTINRRMWTSNPGHGVNCIRCYHQSLSVSNMSYNLIESEQLHCAVSRSHRSPQKVLFDRSWKTLYNTHVLHRGWGDIFSLFSFLDWNWWLSFFFLVLFCIRWKAYMISFAPFKLALCWFLPIFYPRF